jgi:acetoacetyl-CoA synthetase
MESETVELWRHSNPENTAMYKFKELISEKYNLEFSAYHDLWQWSVDHPGLFWEEVWHFTGIKAHEPYKTVRGDFSCVLIFGMESIIIV